MEGLLFSTTGRYEDAFASSDRVIALGRELGRSVRVLLNYSTMGCRQVFDLEEARRRSEEALSLGTRSSSFHMPWMNAAVDLVETDVLAGEPGSALARWTEVWDDALATTPWERWLLGGRLAVLRAAIALDAEGPDAATEWADRAIDMARGLGRAKYEAAAQGVLAIALVALGRADEAVARASSAVDTAVRVGSPFGIWRARDRLAQALAAAHEIAGAEREWRQAAAVIDGVAEGSSPERRAGYSRRRRSAVAAIRWASDVAAGERSPNWTVRAKDLGEPQTAS